MVVFVLGPAPFLPIGKKLHYGRGRPIGDYAGVEFGEAFRNSLDRVALSLRWNVVLSSVGDQRDVELCQGAYAQVDFAEGDVIADLCDERYGNRVLEAFDRGSYEGVLPGVGQDAGPFTIEDGQVTIEYDPDDKEQVSLAVYRVPDPDFESDTGNISFQNTRCRQVLFDSDTDPDQEGALTADLPTP